MTSLHDNVMLVDGPLGGREFETDKTPRAPLDFTAAISMDGKILAVEGEPAPHDEPFRAMAFRYAPMMAKDGHQSRDDRGRLLFYYAASEDR